VVFAALWQIKSSLFASGGNVGNQFFPLSAGTAAQVERCPVKYRFDLSISRNVYFCLQKIISGNTFGDRSAWLKKGG
jgi:hypothetical protein